MSKLWNILLCPPPIFCLFRLCLNPAYRQRTTAHLALASQQPTSLSSGPAVHCTPTVQFTKPSGWLTSSCSPMTTTFAEQVVVHTNERALRRRPDNQPTHSSYRWYTYRDRRLFCWDKSSTWSSVVLNRQMRRPFVVVLSFVFRLPWRMTLTGSTWPKGLDLPPLSDPHDVFCRRRLRCGRASVRLFCFVVLLQFVYLLTDLTGRTIDKRSISKRIAESDGKL